MLKPYLRSFQKTIPTGGLSGRQGQRRRMVAPRDRVDARRGVQHGQGEGCRGRTVRTFRAERFHDAERSSEFTVLARVHDPDGVESGEAVVRDRQGRPPLRTQPAP
jgi:hypothetical protein